jgi:hypothetical protein
MTCRGYNPKTVKISKTVKRVASTIIDPHVRGEFIRSYVEVAKNNANVRTSKKDSFKS